MDSILKCLCDISFISSGENPDPSRLDALWRCQSTLDGWLTVTISVTVIGLIFELLEWVPPKRMRLRIAARIPKLTPSMHWLRHSTYCIGEFLVIVGVAGEVVLHVNSSSIGTEIRGIQDARASAQEQLIADTNKKTATLTAENLRIRQQLAPRKLYSYERGDFHACGLERSMFSELSAALAGIPIKIQAAPDFEAASLADDLLWLLKGCLLLNAIKIEPADSDVDPLKIRSGVAVYWPCTDNCGMPLKGSPLKGPSETLAKVLADKIGQATAEVFIPSDRPYMPPIVYPWPVCRSSPCSDIFVLIGLKPGELAPP
jgi:hypothetical protein